MADFSKGQGKAALPQEPKPRRHTKIAKYDGQCPECLEPIVADVDEIEMDFEGQWVHEGCG